MILKNLFGIYMTTEEFIEKYCLVNGKHIKLSNVQKKFIKWLQSIKCTQTHIRII